MTEAVIVATARTAIGRANKGSLVNERADDMSAAIITALMEKVPQVSKDAVEDVIWGCGHPAGEAGYCIAKVAAVLAGIDAPGVVVNRYCASSLQTVRMAMHAIRAGEGSVFIAGGVEAISRYEFGMADDGPHNPRFAEAEARSRQLVEDGAEWQPAPGLPDVYMAMGQTAENVRQSEGVTRRDMDEYALMSQERAIAAQDRGFFADEITPLTLGDGSVFDTDECPRRGTTLERLEALKPAFRPDGEVTAGNSCPLNDGAAAALVMSADTARDLGVEPLARVVATGVSSIDPEIMGLGPVDATRNALKHAGMTVDDIDLFEINEAFAAQVIPSARRLGIDYSKLNVNGGAIALGHPYGSTGARMLTTLIHSLQERDETFGLETMCVGSGQGMAMIVERLS